MKTPDFLGADIFYYSLSTVAETLETFQVISSAYCESSRTIPAKFRTVTRSIENSETS